MESDFTTRQHIDSLVSNNDPNIAEVLNKYKFPPANPQPQPQMGNYGPYFGGAPQSNNEIFLGAMLGQIQASMQTKQPENNINGFQLNINSEVLKWLIALLLIATLIWLVFRLSNRERSPLKRRLRKLERNYRKLKKLKRKNPKPLPEPDLESDLDDDDLDDDDDDWG